MALGLGLIIAIILFKYKPTYVVSLCGEQIGYVSNAAELQNRIYAQNKHWQEVFVDKTIRPQLIALSDTNSVSKLFHLSFSIDFTNIESFIRHWSSKYN